MATTSVNDVLRRLARGMDAEMLGQDADRQLVERALAQRDAAALQAIVRRHGAMVYRVCWRILQHTQDAEDAFQATFLVLAQKLRSVRKHASLASWLHGVAHRVSVRAKQQAHSRRRRESRASVSHSTLPDDLTWKELRSALDSALNQLPDKWRLPLVLCYLEGRTQEEAAKQLAWSKSTLRSRLEEARDALARRLAKRGITLPAALSAVLLSDCFTSAAPAPGVVAGVVEAMVAIAAGKSLATAASAPVALLTEGVIKAMVTTKIKTASVVLLAATTLMAIGIGTAAFPALHARSTAQPDPIDEPKLGQRPAPKDDPAVALVRQLGDADFKLREDAAKKLRDLGTKAIPALRAGTRDASPEVSRRAGDVLGAVRREQLWAVFTRIAGDDQTARDLFGQIMASTRAVAALEAALDDPSRADELYRTRTAELLRVAGGHAAVGPDGKADPPGVPDIHAAPPVPLGDVAGWLLLGALQPGTSAWSQVTHPGWQGLLNSYVPFLPEDDYTSAKPIHEAYTAANAAALKKLTAAWLAKRRENDGLQAGLTLAIRYDIADAVTAARTVLNDPKPQAIRRCNLAAAAVLLGLHGTKADLPLLARHTTDDREHMTILNLPPGTDLRFARPQTQDGRDLFCQVRDAVAVAMCKLARKDPADFGFPSFPATKHPNGRPMSLMGATAVGFKANADRAAAFGKAAAWLKSFEPPTVPTPKPDPAAEKLVKQLGDPDFKLRDDAVRQLRALGVKAIPALQAGTRDASPEVRKRAQEVLVAVRADARDALAKQFDSKKTEEYDHPVWKRFVAIAGDSLASRELFALIIANAKWLRTLDDAEADAATAGHIYRVGIAEVFRDYNNDTTKSPFWPCDRPEEVAYLLLLGSHPDPNPPAKLTGDEVVPTNGRSMVALGRGIIHGEGQITHANGLDLGLKGKIRFFYTPEIVGAPGTDRVFGKLLAAWLVRRDPSSVVVPRGLRLASGQRNTEVLPLARRYAANDFDPKRNVPPLVTIAALGMVAQLGTRADLPLFERHFDDETKVAAVDKASPDGARDYFRPAPLTETTQLRDVALGLTLLLHGANPEDFGFVVRRDTFKQKDGRYTIPWSTQLHLGFASEASRTAAFKKAKAWLIDQKPKVDPPASKPGSG